MLAVYSQYTTLNVGDKVKIGDEELEIGCVVSEGVGSVSGSAVVVSFGRNLYTLNRRTGLCNGRRLCWKKMCPEMAVNKIYDLAEGNIIADSREKKQRSKWLLLGYSELLRIVFWRLFPLLPY